MRWGTSGCQSRRMARPEVADIMAAMSQKASLAARVCAGVLSHCPVGPPAPAPEKGGGWGVGVGVGPPLWWWWEEEEDDV